MRAIFIFIYRLLINILILFLVSLPLEWIGILILPGILWFQKYSGRIGQLPRLFIWFDNADTLLGRDTSTYKEIIESGFWYRYYWLAIRNPLNYFGYKVLGIKVTQELFEYTSNNNFNVGDSQGHSSGLLWTETKQGYEYYYILKWNKNKCLRFRMGFKIGCPEGNIVGSWIEHVFVLQPYKDYYGE